MKYKKNTIKVTQGYQLVTCFGWWCDQKSGTSKYFRTEDMNAPDHWCYFEPVCLADLGKSACSKFHQREDMNAPAGVGVTFALLCWCYFGITLVLLLRAAFWRGVACLCWCLVLGGRGSDQVPRWRASLHCTARLLLARFHCCLHTS